MLGKYFSGSTYIDVANGDTTGHFCGIVYGNGGGCGLVGEVEELGVREGEVGRPVKNVEKLKWC